MLLFTLTHLYPIPSFFQRAQLPPSTLLFSPSSNFPSSFLYKLIPCSQQIHPCRLFFSTAALTSLFHHSLLRVLLPIFTDPNTSLIPPLAKQYWIHPTLILLSRALVYSFFQLHSLPTFYGNSSRSIYLLSSYPCLHQFNFTQYNAMSRYQISFLSLFLHHAHIHLFINIRATIIIAYILPQPLVTLMYLYIFLCLKYLLLVHNLFWERKPSILFLLSFSPGALNIPDIYTLILSPQQFIQVYCHI